MIICTLKKSVHLKEHDCLVVYIICFVLLMMSIVVANINLQ